MSFFTTCLIIAVSLLGLALFANQRRARETWDFELKPNCLLTRWPLLFVTGPRSIFYFSKYWNHYTSFLAEHGYEVFTLHLPWNKESERLARLQQFLLERSAEGRHFHLVVESFTMSELQKISPEAFPCLVSVTEVCDAEKGPQMTGLQGLRVPWSPVELSAPDRGSYLGRFAFSLHRKILGPKARIRFASLGACPKSREENALLLLERAQILAETDLGTP